MIRAGSVATRALAESIRKAPLTPEKVRFAWRMVVGPALDHATSVHLSPDGVLYVKAETAAWTAAVRGSSGLIRDRLEYVLGAGVVRRIDCGV